MLPSEFLDYTKMLIVAILGATVGYIVRVAPNVKNKGFLEKATLFLQGVFISSFIAYLTFEIAILFVDDVGLRVAFGGVASFLGTPLLLTLEKEIIIAIREKLHKDYKEGEK